ncbi:MAG: hypothetical protein WD046_00370 [Paracoccaceae bacterium]
MEAFHVHLGLRKTGTTYLQRWLDRSTLAPGTIWVNERKSRETLLPEMPLPDYLATDATVVISDENLLRGFRNGSVFSRPTRQLLRLRPFTPSLFICLRNYADHFTSSWVETLKRQSFRPFDPGERPDRRWPDVLREIAKAFPDSPVTVWDYADMRGNEAAIAQLITGNHVREFGPPPKPQINQRMSVNAVAHLAALAQPPEKGKAFREFLSAHPVSESNPRFETFTAETRKPFDAAYKEDWDDIAKYATIWRPNPQTPSQ